MPGKFIVLNQIHILLGKSFTRLVVSISDKYKMPVRLTFRHAHNLLRPPQQLQRLRSGRRPPDVITQFGNHLVQRLDLFIADAGLGDLHELEHGLRSAMIKLIRCGSCLTN
jgi:hypothetical protein